MARPGEKIVTNTEFEKQLRQLSTKIDGILSFLFFIGGSEIKDFIVQGDYASFTGPGLAITFPIPFKVGTIPLVLITSLTKEMVVTMDAYPTATGFTGYGRYILDDSAGSCAGAWVAIGERG